MGMQVQPVNAICFSSQTDVGAVYLAAAQRYFWLRDQALRTGYANVPMVRQGMGDPLGGFELDGEVDDAMSKWPMPATPFDYVAPAPALDYELTSVEAEFLLKVVQAPTQGREGLLLEYAKSAGLDDSIRLLTQVIGCANAVIENCRVGAHPMLPVALSKHVWTRSLPECSGHYWNWGGQPGVEAELVLVLRDTVAGCFSVSEGALGLSKAVPCAQFGGWWALVQKPNAHSEIDAASSPPPAMSNAG